METNFEILQSRDGYNIVKLDIDDKILYLGSKYNQKREIEKFMKNVHPITEKDNYVIIGLGGGEHIKELLKNIYKDSKVLIIEPNKELIDYFKGNEELNKIFVDDRVFISNKLGDVDVEDVLDLNITNIDYLHMFITTNYLTAYKKELDERIKEIKDIALDISCDRNTTDFFKEVWTENRILNFENLINGVAINDLRNKYKDVPAVIVSAGPSLEKNIKDLKLSDNALIFSCGRTLRGLFSIGVMPDYTVVIDGGEVSYEIGKEFWGELKTPLIISDGTNHKVVESHKGINVVSSTQKVVQKIYGQNLYSIAVGGSVAHSMVESAIIMGCNPIIFIGQDLAYTDNKMHSDMVKNKDGSYNDMSNDKDKNNDIFVDGVNGKKVRTSLIYYQFKNELEAMIKAFPETEFINATEGGADIKGTKIKTLKEVMEECNKISKDKKASAAHLKREFRNKKAVKMLKEIVANMNLLGRKCRHGKKLLEKFVDAYNKDDKIQMGKLNNKLNEIDKLVRRSVADDTLDIMENILVSASYHVSSDEKFVIQKNDNEDEIFRKKIDANKYIYDFIEKSVVKYYDSINQLLSKLSKEER